MILRENDTLLIGADFASAATGPYKSQGELELLPGGKRLQVLSCLGCSDTSDALLVSLRKEGRRGNIMTQAI